MTRPLTVLLATLLLTTGARADEAFRPAALPPELSAPVPARPHTPSPFPDEEELEFQGDGANGWAILAGVLAGGAAVSGLVSAASHAQLKNPDTPPSELRAHRERRNLAGYTALGLTGGAGLSLVIAIVR